MADRLTAKQVVPLTEEERAELRDMASAHEITPGLLARALLLRGMGELRSGDAMSLRAVAAEKIAAAKRITAGARAAVAQRWGK
ncbi:hypothetical protein GCM10027169_00250 [Gordonia jinhuaensis]|uniref:Uncharacterized protein n=1 Tax=Gordonia jinhuaensis TaxID=1517702 RepID=A0A916SUX9_9ACTN|nr:hypothetical protein [Gordonia jinhuaensis]GGB18265.1 hypothetical protein GCM10011489_02910 [Gordonia jinhuaensis]